MKENSFQKPFTIGVSQEEDMAEAGNPMIKPFTCDARYGEAKEKAIIEDLRKKAHKLEMEVKPRTTDPKEVQKEIKRPMIKPFTYVTQESADIAENFAHLLGGYDQGKFMIPYLAKAIDDQRKAGGVVPPAIAHLLPVVQSDLNFCLSMNKIITSVLDTEEGEKERTAYEVEVTVFLRKGESRRFVEIVPAEKIKGTDWLKKATRSLATIPRNSDEKDEFLKMVQLCIEQANVPEERRYAVAGWRNIPGVGWRYIYKDGAIGDSQLPVRIIGEKYSLDVRWDQLGTSNIFTQAIQMTDVCRDRRTSSELFVITHAAVLRTLFEEADCQIKFVYGILGVTNSRKTSISQALTQVFDRQKLMADAEFDTATDCGIEKTLSLFLDAPVHIDDFKPGINATEQARADVKLSKLVRMYGDRVPRRRMNDYIANGAEKYFPVGGVCIITMEIVTGVTSSMSRMFLSEITMGDVCDEKLLFYQKNKYILSTHLYDFIAWATNHFSSIVEYIAQRVPLLRTQYDFEYARYREMYAIFLVTAELIAGYAKERGFWVENEEKTFVDFISEIICMEIHIMENRIRRRDKGTLILAAFKYAIESGKVVFYDLTEENCKGRWDWYQNESFYFCRAKELRRVVGEYCSAYKEPMQIVNEDDLISALERKQVLEILDVNGKKERARKLPMQKGNTLRYLYLKKSAIENLESET